MSSLAFSPDGQTLASGSFDHTIMLWDAAAGQPLAPPLTGHAASVWGLFFSPDDRVLVSGGGDGRIILWDSSSLLNNPPAAALEPLAPPIAGQVEMETMALSPDGRTLALGGFDGNVILLDISFEPWPVRACHIANRNLSRAEVTVQPPFALMSGVMSFPHVLSGNPRATGLDSR